MRKFWLLHTLLLVFSLSSVAQFQQIGNRMGGNGPGGQRPGMQRGMDMDNNQDQEEGSQTPFIPREVKTWHLADDYSLSDTIAVDTLSTGFQIYNPVYQRSIVNAYTGNLGAPAKSVVLEDFEVKPRFLFVENLDYWFTDPDKWRYYNTRTPYTNLYYQHSGPKNRSEEHVGVIFTQNVNEDLNFGFNYKLISSVGKYQAQKVEDRFFRFFSSYSGEKYSLHGSFFYGKADQFKNGGIITDNEILNPQDNEYDGPEYIPVNFTTASTRIDNYKLFINQKLDIGKVNIQVNDSTEGTTPLATASHTFELNRYRRAYKIDELQSYYQQGTEIAPFYSQILIDPTQTKDTTYHNTIRNTIQLKFNEEANPFLRFGMRVYLMNEWERLKWPAPSTPVLNEAGTDTTDYIYRKDNEQRSATAIGGQLFKNRGNNFFFDGGLRIWFQGHKAGDSEITGGLRSQFRIRKDTAGFFARGGVYLTSPGFFTEKYYSNHFEWNKRFDPTKTIKVQGGIFIPTQRLNLTGEIRLIDDYVFWNQEALPEQTSAFLKLIQVKLKKHFQLWNLHSRNEIVYQITSNDEIVPLPEVSVFSSNYFENTLFQVLFFQIGFDLRYHTAYYAPDFMPATGQFFIQRQRKVGNYPVINPFVNFHLKRANIFVKYDHINQGYPDNNYFHTIGYPINPGGLRFGVSWNFYD
ncbi:putative porin [Marinilabilia rubra]|uniref:Porin n=1 Tax=Marinilabilia rubra TaxID=2162893 RepID=A0A2U2B4L1_9BACT|nr:putative porin [Marinilabilia rubra]PWD97974.1 hypothetical protein DDZ16_18050 [Marinilabilia rubra]